MLRSPTAATLCLALFTTACQQVVLPLPTQRALPAYRLNAMLEMDPGQPSWPGASIVAGVLPDDQRVGWRWTGAHPAFRFNLDQPDGWQFEARITAIQSVLSKTGPQTAKFLVNGKAVQTLKMDHADSYNLHLPLPPALIGQPPAVTTVELLIQPCLTETEGPPFCVLLHRIGFTRELR